MPHDAGAAAAEPTPVAAVEQHQQQVQHEAEFVSRHPSTSLPAAAHWPVAKYPTHVRSLHNRYIQTIVSYVGYVNACVEL